MILTRSSDYFKTLFESGMMESESNEILIEEEEDEEVFSNFIKFLYTGYLDYTSEETLLNFMIISNKYVKFLILIKS
jgi:hypothetical protein